jgi:large subunit ribosomal protein L3
MRLMGRKRGMTQRFDDQGRLIPCTVIEIEPNVIVQLKSVERDGYTAIQLGCEEVKAKDPRTLERRIGKPRAGHFKSGNVAPRRHLKECRVELAESVQVGDQFTVEFFSEVSYVDVTAISKGRGFQGTMKRHNFRGGPASHGCEKVHRSPGSIGNRSTPGWVYPGRKMSGHMGAERVTVLSLQVVAIEPDLNVLLVRGAVPGATGDLVSIRPAVKKK